MAFEFNATEAERFRARTRRSRELHERTMELMPTGHAGGMSLFLPGSPITIDRAKGCWIWDVDGNRYLDLRLGDWVLIHGHCDEDVSRGVREQMTRAWQIGAPEWDLGYRMASLLCERMPSLEKVRFFASGTDANLCALRPRPRPHGPDQAGQGGRQLPRHRRRAARRHLAAAYGRATTRPSPASS